MKNLTKALTGLTLMLAMMTSLYAETKDCCTDKSCCNGQSCCRKVNGK